MVGASGAISGVMGAYLVLFPRVRVFTFVPLVLHLHDHRAAGVGDADLLGGPAARRRLRAHRRRRRRRGFWAHVGGFMAGVVLVKLFESPTAAGAPRASLAARTRRLALIRRPPSHDRRRLSRHRAQHERRDRRLRTWVTQTSEPTGESSLRYAWGARGTPATRSAWSSSRQRNSVR